MYAHGFGCSQAMWAAVTPAFEHCSRQVLFDFVGSGQSDISQYSFSRYADLNGYADDILEICDALELTGDIIFVGHSVSCSIGILAANRRPGLFKAMILLGPSPCFLNMPPDYAGGFEQEDLAGLIELMDQNYLGWANYLAPVVAGAHGLLLVQLRLTTHAQAHTADRRPPRLGNGCLALGAMAQAFARRQLAAGALDGVLDAAVDLLLHRPVTGPTACHAVLPPSACEDSGMGATATFYKPGTYSCTSINSRAQTK